MSSSVHVILGAGQAAAWAATAMRKSGFDGRVVVVGQEPHAPYERPPLSKEALTAEAMPPPLWFFPEETYREAGIELVTGTAAQEIDLANRLVRLDRGAPLGFDRLLIATGGRPRRPGAHGSEHALVLRTWDDAQRLREAMGYSRRLVCIGAGVIGLEVASSARALGLEVVVLEAADRPMGRCVSPEGAAWIDGLHRAAGVEIVYGAEVEFIERSSFGYTVSCADGTAITTDLVVAAVGMERNDAIAAAAGIACHNGVLVDASGAASAEGVFAAGDVAAFLSPALGRHVRLESWHHAQSHGALVGQAMCGEDVSYSEIPWFWSDQHGANLQVLGLPAEAAQTVVRPASEASPFTAIHLGQDGTILGATVVNGPRDIRAVRSLMRKGAKVDPARIADASVPLASISD